VYMSNAPYKGGTHLPDITVATPVLDADTGQLDFVVASRAHHADVGGMTPGSMPPLSTSIDEEGLVFDNVKIVRDGNFLENDTLGMFRVGRYPARNPEQNIADLKAQIAANARGIKELERANQRFGRVLVRSYMAHIKRNAESSVREAISRLDNGRWTTVLDTGEEIHVAIEVDRRRLSATVDFRGSSPTSPRNFNAPAAIAKSAVLYAFRSLVAEDIPLNAGCLDPISIVLPQDSIVNPRYPAAVVGGNVETSQCITDAIFAALGVLASSQGTMNNFAFGNERHQYYETLCGGAGASADADGATAVHTHMTNSKLTDPEVLEWRFPVRLRRFEVRRKSGGPGRHHGGDGIIREIEFLEPMSAGILSNRRRTAPFGIAGGHAGQKGRNYVVRANGSVDRLAGIDQTSVSAGDRFVIETPGGGGYGPPGTRRPRQPAS
jgi:5-oxoprolinase (ATP-hydrolysing)